MAKNLATSAPRTALTDESGNYRITNLLPGNYEALIEKPGFKSLEFSQIALTVDLRTQTGRSLGLFSNPAFGAGGN